MFTLYKNDPLDPPKRVVSFNDLDNKAFWCQLGEDKERAFVKVMSKINSPYQVKIHPEKKINPYHPDLLVNFNSDNLIGEVKVKNSPLFIANKYKVNPQYALTMDLKDSFNYNKLLMLGIDVIIFAWIRWEAHEMQLTNKTYKVAPMRGVWVTRFSKIRAKETSNNPPGIHWYYERYRHPPEYNPGGDMNEETSKWCNELLKFEPRLKKTNGRVSGITSTGFFTKCGTTYPTGHSSASYVFDLSDSNIFTELYLHI
jgi:hypothetical protein